MRIYYSDTYVDVDVNDNSYRYRAVMGDHTLTLYFSLTEYAEIPVGARCEFQGETYTLEKPVSVKRNGARNLEYTAVFEASQARLKRFKVHNTVPGDSRLKFSYTARPKEHLKLIVDNMNLRDAGWTAGECVDAAEKPVAYNHTYCYDALQTLAQTFSTEWSVEGKTISLRKAGGEGTPLELSYGRDNGFRPGVGRSNVGDTKAVEVLYVQGGDKNMLPGKYGNKELLLPAGQTIRYDGVHFEDEEGFDARSARSYVADGEGLSLRRADRPLQSGTEESLDLSNIYPRWQGKVKMTGDGSLYEFGDERLASGPDFSQCVIAGETMTVIFQSGMLAGREFEADFDPERKLFRIVPQMQDGVEMPGGAYVFGEGDGYSVFHVEMPYEYIRNDRDRSGASWEMMREAVKYLWENEQPRFSFTGELDGIWAKRRWLNISDRLRLGCPVLFRDGDLAPEGTLMRITGIREMVNDPYGPTIELSNTTAPGSVVASLSRIEQEEVVAEDRHREAVNFTRRRFRDSQEAISMLEKSLLDFGKSIDPITVRTMMISLGDPGLQFEFVPQTEGAEFRTEGGRLIAPAGTVTHLTLTRGAADGGEQTPPQALEWTLEGRTFTGQDAGTRYYLYVKGSTEGGSAEYLLSEEAVGLKSTEGYYHLLVGMLGTEDEQGRTFTPLYGFTEVSPSQIVTPRITSRDGNAYFDLTTGQIAGRIEFIDAKGQTRTLIEGGKLATDAIDTQRLVVEQVSTVPNESNNWHIEIDSQNNSVAMLDETDTPRLMIHGKNYTGVEDISGVQSVDPAPLSGTSFSMSRLASESGVYIKDDSDSWILGNFLVPDTGQYMMKVPPLRVGVHGAVTGVVEYFDIVTDMRIELYKGGTYYQELYADSFFMTNGRVPGYDTEISPLVAYELEAGAYSVQVTFRGHLFYTGHPAQPADPGPSVRLTVSLDPGTAGDVIQVAGQSQVTKIFANGLASVWDSDRYFAVVSRPEETDSDLIRAKGNMRFLAENSRYGLRVTNAGLLHTNDGELWCGMMPGVVYAGRVDGSLPKILRSWKAPGMENWSIQRHNGQEGRYLISMGYTFASADDYAVLFTTEYGYARTEWKNANSFVVWTGDDETANNANFTFLVLDVSHWGIGG